MGTLWYSFWTINTLRMAVGRGLTIPHSCTTAQDVSLRCGRRWAAGATVVLLRAKVLLADGMQKPKHKTVQLVDTT